MRLVCRFLRCVVNGVASGGPGSGSGLINVGKTCIRRGELLRYAREIGYNYEILEVLNKSKEGNISVVFENTMTPLSSPWWMITECETSTLLLNKQISINSLDF